MDTAGNKTSCQWSDTSVCSIVNYPGRPDICNACNSLPLVSGCYTGDYRCAMNLNFNGTCYQWIDNPSECLTSATQDCDETCTENCLNAASGFSSNADDCAALCCKASGRPATTPPTCATGAPAMSGGAGGVSATGGGSNGGASAGTSSGASTGTSSGASTGTSSGGADARDAGAGGTGAGPAAADAGANKGGASAAGDGQGGGGGGGFGI